MKRSPVWQFFEKNEVGGVCRLQGCNKQLYRKKDSGSTKQFWDHLYHGHRSLYTMIKEGHALQNIASAGLGEVVDCSTEDVVEQVRAQARESMLETAFQREALAKENIERCRNTHALRVIIQNNLPFSIVEEESFRELVEKAYPGAGKPLPHSNYFASTLLEESAKKVLNAAVEQLQNSYFAITCNYWTKDGSSLLNITAHTITAEFKRRNALLAAVPCEEVCQNAENMAFLMRSVFQQHSIPDENIVAIVRDGAPNMEKTVELLGRDQLSFQCAALALHNQITQCFSEASSVKDIIRKCRSLVNYLHRSVYASNQLKKELKDCNMTVGLPCQDVLAMWSSTYHMVQSVLQITPVLTNVKQKVMGIGSTERFPEQLSFYETKAAEELCRVLKVLETQSLMLYREDATCSLYIPVFAAMQNFLCKAKRDSQYAHIRDFLDLMFTKGEQILQWARSKDILKISMFADPRFVGCQYFHEEDWVGIRRKFENFVVEHLRREAPESEKQADVPGSFSAFSRIGSSQSEQMQNACQSGLGNDILQYRNGSRGMEVNEDTVDSSCGLDLFADARRCGSQSQISGYSMRIRRNIEYETRRFIDEANLSVYGDLFQWYRENSPSFPLMSRVARLLFSIPPATITSEVGGKYGSTESPA